MDLFSVIVPKMVYFLILMALGYVLGLVRIVPKESLPTFSGLVVKVLLPALQMSVIFQRGATFMTFLSMRRFVLLQLGVYALLALAGVAGSALLRVPFPARNSFRGGMVGGNVGFLLVPLIMSVFPPEGGQAYIPCLVAVDTVVVWSVGLMFYTQGTGGAGGGIRAFLSRLFNPMFCAIVLALALSSLHVEVPRQVRDVIDAVGATSGTLGLMILGVNIFYMDKHMKGSLLPFAGFIGIRQIIMPVAVYLLARYFASPVEATLLMLLCAIPAMTTTSLLAITYHTDVDFASNLVFLSTVASLGTIPLVTLVAPLL